MKPDPEIFEKRKKQWMAETRAIRVLMEKQDMSYQEAIRERARLYKIDWNKK